MSKNQSDGNLHAMNLHKRQSMNLTQKFQSFAGFTTSNVPQNERASDMRNFVTSPNQIDSSRDQNVFASLPGLLSKAPIITVKGGEIGRISSQYQNGSLQLYM